MWEVLLCFMRVTSFCCAVGCCDIVTTDQIERIITFGKQRTDNKSLRLDLASPRLCLCNIYNFEFRHSLKEVRLTPRCGNGKAVEYSSRRIIECRLHLYQEKQQKPNSALSKYVSNSSFLLFSEQDQSSFAKRPKCLKNK